MAQHGEFAAASDDARCLYAQSQINQYDLVRKLHASAEPTLQCRIGLGECTMRAVLNEANDIPAPLSYEGSCMWLEVDQG